MFTLSLYTFYSVTVLHNTVLFFIQNTAEQSIIFGIYLMAFYTESNLNTYENNTEYYPNNNGNSDNTLKEDVSGPKVTKEQRKQIKDLVLNTIQTLHGKIDGNYRYWEAFIDSKSDEELYAWADWCGQDYENTITLTEEPFVDITLNNLEKAAKYLGIELEEYVYYYDQNPNGERTATKVPVGVLPIKRMQQLLSKKNRYTYDNDKTSLMTGQVTGESKVAGFSDAEATAVLSWGADEIFEELYGPRSGSQAMKQAMYKQIADDGVAELSEIRKYDTPESHSTATTINAFMIASGIQTDLVVNTLKTAYTLKTEQKVINNK